ncbi:MAG: META domain-containing protein [Acidimicrobiales bacterium]
MSEVPEVSSPDPAPGDPPAGPGRRPILLAALGVAVLLVVVLVAIAVTGDDDDDDVSTGPVAEAVPFWGTTWRIVTITKGGDDATPDLPEGKDLLDASEEGRISFTGCNGGSGAASLDGAELVVDEMMQTQMACMDDDGQVLMDHDAFMVEFLRGRPTVAIEGDRLVLTGADATITLEAVGDASSATSTTAASADPDAPVSTEAGPWGSTWTITAISSGGNAVDVVDTPSGDAPVIDLTSEGTVSYTGCNGGRGEANYGAGKLAVGPIMSTKKACEDAGLMAQDDFLSSLLTSVPEVSIEGDTLTLTADQDQVVATRG